jgi:hypothetical protein
MSSTTTVVPSLFYTRRIGLNGSRVIPIEVGGRLTGKVGRFGVGAMNIETGDDPDVKTPRTNFSVVRVKRDILRRSTIGAMVTNRTATAALPGVSNVAFGADAAFSFFQNLNLAGYYARSETEGFKRDNDSYLGRFDYAGDRYGAQAQYLKVGDNFAPTSASFDATTCAARSDNCASVRGRRSGSRASGSSPIKAASNTSKTARVSWRAESRPVPSRPSGRTATCSRSTSRRIMNCC